MLRILLLLVPFLLPSSLLIAQAQRTSCPRPSNAITSSVTDYTLKKYHVEAASQLLLQDSGPANAECYWRFHFQIASSRRDVVLYLTPDSKYLVPALYDRSSDPFAEERKEQEEVLHTLTSGHAASRGPLNSKVTLVEFSDFECPYCQRLTSMLAKDVLPANPDVRVVFRNFPLTMHPWAQNAAQIAACAQMQSDEAFWKAHDYIFSHQKELSQTNIIETLLQFADTIPEIDHSAFHDCVDRELTMGPIAKDVSLGNRLGVRATPTVFINGSRIEGGVRDSAQLQDLITQARSGKPLSGATPTEAAAAQNPVARNGCTTPNR